MAQTTSARRKRSPRRSVDSAAADTDDFLTAFNAALTADFRGHGAGAIAAARDKDPVTYLKICASILQRAEGPDPDPMTAVSDEQLLERARRAAASLGFRLEPEPSGASVAAEPAETR